MFELKFLRWIGFLFWRWWGVWYGILDRESNGIKYGGGSGFVRLGNFKGLRIVGSREVKGIRGVMNIEVRGR